MNGVNWFKHITRAFRQDERGVTAVEFVIILPVMLVLFAAIVEGSRIYWNYQSAVTGVRDAARFLARTTNVDICGGTANTTAVALTGGATTATNIIADTMRNEQGLFPSGVTVTAVSATYTCPDYNLRTDPTPVARVQATVNVQMPFGTLFEFFKARNTTVMTSVITDQSRIYGL